MSQPLTLRTEAGDELLDLAEFEQRVRRGEVSPQCLVRFPAVTGEHFVPACELELWKGLHEPRRAYFARAFKLGQFPWLTALVAAINVGVYAVTVAGGPLDVDAMVRYGGKVRPLMTDLGEMWRLFSANFLHKDALHVGMNMVVFLMVGGALESAYRALDYLLLLLVAGLATMGVSLWLAADAVTVGASGMVYGCLGAVVVFGLKYRNILPAVYRRVLGEAAIPVVLVCLWIGWTSVGVDNAAHAGGLLSGMGVALFLKPRLLADFPRSRFGVWARVMPMAALLLAVGTAQAWVGGFLPHWVTVRDDNFGISVSIPDSWRRGANTLGQLAYYNGLTGLGRATFAAEAVVNEGPADVRARARRFMEDGLRPSNLGPEVFRVRNLGSSPARVADRDGLRIDAEFDEPWGTSVLRAYFIARGDVVYQLVFSFPAAFPRYAQVMDTMVAGIRLDEPRELRQARARALLFPGRAWSLGRLGQALRRMGEPVPAAEALRTAVREQPASVPLRRQLALTLLQAGQVDEACAAAKEAAFYGPDIPEALEVEARCEVARGNPGRALERIRAARSLAPADVQLKQAEAALRAVMKEGAGESPLSP